MKNSPLVTVALADLVLFQAVVPLLQCGIISKFCIKSLQRFLLMKVYYENFHTRMKNTPSKIPIFWSINLPKIFIFHNFFTGGVVGKNLHPERNLTSRVFKRPKLLKIREIENCKEFAWRAKANCNIFRNSTCLLWKAKIRAFEVLLIFCC